MKRERRSRTGERDERWLERHGLERDPFPDAEPGPEFFTRGGRDRLVEGLVSTSSPAPSLVAVTGDAGVGKSTIFHAMLRVLPGDVHVARISAGVFLSAKHLLTAVSTAIGTDADPDASRPELRRIVYERLQALFAAEARCFVLVDDAGELEADALDELVQLAELEPVGIHLRVVLFAQPGIRDALGKASGGQRVGPLLHEVLVERYALNELRGYLQFRLARAGQKGASPFSEDDYAEIFRRSQGIPGRANAIAGRMLRAETPAVDQRKLHFIAAGAAAALIVAALALFTLGGGEEAPATTTVAAPTLPEPLPTPDLVGDAGPRTLTASEAEEAGAWIEDGTVQRAVSAAAAVAPVQVTLTPAEPEPEVEVPTTAVLDAIEEEAASVSRSATTSVAAASASAEAQPADTRSADTRSAEARSVDTRSVDTRSVDTRSAEAAPVSDVMLSLAAMDPDHFVLQVLVNSTSDRAETFIGGQQDADAFRYYERRRNGVAQYVVVYGDFSAQGDASGAIERVAAQTGQSPWVRRVADVQRELAAN